MKTLILLSMIALGQFATAHASETSTEVLTVTKFTKTFQAASNGKEKCDEYKAKIAASNVGEVLKSKCMAHIPNHKGDTYKYTAYVLIDSGTENRSVLKFTESFEASENGSQKCEAYLAQIAASNQGNILKSNCLAHVPFYKGDTYKYIAYVLVDVGSAK